MKIRRMERQHRKENRHTGKDDIEKEREVRYRQTNESDRMRKV